MLPQDNGTGKWTLASPTTVGTYSAVAYYFSKKLQTDLKGPVGFIQSSFGGTQLEQWMSSEGFDADLGRRRHRRRYRCRFFRSSSATGGRPLCLGQQSYL